MKSSNSFRFTSFWVPTCRSNGQFGRSSRLWILVMLMLVYAVASGMVSVTFCGMGICCSISVVLLKIQCHRPRNLPNYHHYHHFLWVLWGYWVGALLLGPGASPCLNPIIWAESTCNDGNGDEFSFFRVIYAPLDFDSLANVMPTAFRLLFIPFNRRDSTFGWDGRLLEFC